MGVKIALLLIIFANLISGQNNSEHAGSVTFCGHFLNFSL